MTFWKAPAAPCPTCGASTPSDAVERDWAMTQTTIEMTYTCRRCQRLFVATVRPHEDAAPVVIGREAP